jgi:hypothetical protein
VLLRVPTAKARAVRASYAITSSVWATPTQRRRPTCIFVVGSPHPETREASAGSLPAGSPIACSSTFDVDRQGELLAVDDWSELRSSIDAEELELVRA